MTPDATDSAWAAIEALKPRLRAHVRIYRHHYRGEPWYVLQDQATIDYFRFSAAAYRFIGLLDGSRTVRQCREAAGGEDGEGLAPQDIVRMLTRLHAAGLLQFEQGTDIAALFDRRRRETRRRWLQRLMRPLALRFPLFDPERWLERSLPVVRRAFSRGGFVAWLAVVAASLALCATHLPELAAHWKTRALDPRNLLVLALLYPLVKAAHEFGHAYATKVWGGEVHEMGILLLMLMPIPYVDASAANAFPDKRRRMMVGAAGIMVEVFLAALGILLWYTVQPGLVRDIAFDVAVIGGVSTVLFNGNPLLRFDGYYVLADAIEIPNLAARSTRFLAYLGQRYLFGIVGARSPVAAPGERGWLVAYGILSSAYRLFVSLAIALFIAGKLFMIGVVLAAMVLFARVLYPAGRVLAVMLTGVEFEGRRLRAAALVAGTAAALGVLVAWLPVSYSTRAEGVITLPETSLIRAATDGFVARLLVAEGTAVRAGEPLLDLEDPLLGARVSILEGRLHELEARYDAELLKDRLQAEIRKEEIAGLRVELAEAQARLERLSVHSPADGVLVVPRARDLGGRFVRKGDLLGYVTDLSSVTARVVVPQAAADLVRRRTESVEVRLAARPGEMVPARLASEVPAATARLPSRILGTQGGGSIAVDARDAKGVRAIDQVFQFDVALPPGGAGALVGSRVYVRFDHGAEPLLRRWQRSLRQLFLARLRL